jgi:hypothetical protein
MTWDWSMIVTLAQIVGVAGGLVSLVFLILGVRRNARAIEGATVQSLMIFEKDVYTLLAAHADIFVRGCADPNQLTAPDRFRFDRLVNAQMSLFYSAFVQFEQKLIDDEIWTAYRNALVEDLRSPGFQHCWTAMHDNYPVSFRRMIDKT